MILRRQCLILGLIIVITLMSLSCAPGNERWDQEINIGHRAGFWAGIWHGLIVIITFIVSLFTNEVGLYESNNTGWSYNLGFLIGLLFSVGGGICSGTRRKKIRKRDWDKVSEKIEEKVRDGIKDWLSEADKEEKEREWEEIAVRIEERIKKTLEQWSKKK